MRTPRGSLNQSRRRVLAASGAVLLAAGSLRAVSSRPVDNQTQRRAALINRFFGGSHDARAVGASYLTAEPAERDADFLWTRLFGSNEPRDRATCSRLLAERIAEDFRNRDVVHIQGWIVARAEARACALIHLS